MQSTDVELQKVNNILSRLEPEEIEEVRTFELWHSSKSTRNKNLPFIESQNLVRAHVTSHNERGESSSVFIQEEVARIYKLGANSDCRIIKYFNGVADEQSTVTSFSQKEVWIGQDAALKLIELGISEPQTALETFIFHNVIRAIACRTTVSFSAKHLVFSYALEKGYKPRQRKTFANKIAAARAWLKKGQHPSTVLEILHTKLVKMNLDVFANVAMLGSRDKSQAFVGQKKTCIISAKFSQSIQKEFEFINANLFEEECFNTNALTAGDFKVGLCDYEEYLFDIDAKTNFVEDYMQ